MDRLPEWENEKLKIAFIRAYEDWLEMSNLEDTDENWDCFFVLVEAQCESEDKYERLDQKP